MAEHKICLLFSDTGGGHRSATEAIAAGIRDIANQSHHADSFEIVLENIVEKSHPINRWFVNLYNYLLRHHQSLMKYYYGFIQATKPNSSWLNYWLAAGYLKHMILTEKPQVLVSVHPMINHYLSKAVRQLGMQNRIKVITVITDPNENLWSGWACPDVDLIIAPNDLSRNQLVAWGIAPERIRIMGMPVHPDFLKSPGVTREEFFARLGLDLDKLTVCINAGWAGGGNLLEVFAELKLVRRAQQVIFLCGHNTELTEQVREIAQKMTIPVVILPFYQHMADLMTYCDLMVTKAGGLTTFQAVAKRLPMALDLITPAMPQESGTDKMLIEQNLAQGIYRPADIVPIVENLQPVENRISQSLPYAHSLNRIDAIYDIAHTILAACDPLYDPVSERAPVMAGNKIQEEGVGALGFEGPLA